MSYSDRIARTHNAYFILKAAGAITSTMDAPCNRPLTAERAAMERDPETFGAYLARVAKLACAYGEDGYTLSEALDFAFSTVVGAPDELTHTHPSRMEREAVRILIGAQS